MTTTAVAQIAIAKCSNGHLVKRIENGHNVVASGIRLTCICGKTGIAKLAKVTEKECNDTCMAAQGPSCSCSCGGENHGGNKVHS